MLKDNDKRKIVKGAKGKQLITYKETSITPDFSTEIIGARKRWDNIFKMFKEKKPINQEVIFSKAIFQKSRQNKDIPE